jgi:hypothetical protein
MCLGKDFVATNHLIDESISAQAGKKVGVGGDVSVLNGSLPSLQIGGMIISNPSVSFFLQGSPVGPDSAGHIGFAAFRGCRVIFDYARERMIIEVPRERK